MTLVTANEHLGRLLTFFPDTPQGIAGMLRREGITGDLHDCLTCPIAVYLSRKVGEPVFVTDNSISLVSHGYPPHEWSHKIPSGAAAFIAAFDFEEYWDLVSA